MTLAIATSGLKDPEIHSVRGDKKYLQLLRLEGGDIYK